MLLQHVEPLQAPSQHRLVVEFANERDSVLEAQRLRYRVFADELGARLNGAETGIDRDLYDPHCEHLIVRDQHSSDVVGTYRLLPPERAARIGGYYSEDEFDLTRLQHLRGSMLEIGRSCVHPNYRDGKVMAMLWGAIIRYAMQHGHRYLIGCASVSMRDGGHFAASVYDQAINEASSPIEHRVFPRYRLPIENISRAPQAGIPTLIKGYLRLGAYVCGEPAWDPDFNSADLFVILPMAQMPSRYLRHFLAG